MINVFAVAVGDCCCFSLLFVAVNVTAVVVAAADAYGR